jgi:hypothetical protein
LITDPNCSCYFTGYRAPQYLNWFEKAGFQIQKFEKKLYEWDIASDRKQFADDMKPISNEELTILSMTLVLWK